jgi:uncharacterized membrane protein
MKRDIGIIFTVVVGMATFAIALVAGIFLIWETSSSAIAQEPPQSQTSQVALDV